MGSDPILREFDRLAASRPESIVVASPGRSASAGEVDDLAKALADRIDALRSDAGTPAVIRVPNGPAFLAAVIAVRRADRVALLVDRAVPDREEDRIAEAMGASVAVRTMEAWPDSPDDIEIEPLAHLPIEIPANAGWIKMTSGSAGRSVGAAFESEALCADDDALFATMGLSVRDRLLATIPWSHSYGLSSLAIPCLRRGVTLVVPRERGPWAPLDAARALEASFFPTVPAFLGALTSVERSPDWPASLRNVVSAGAPLPPETAARFRERFGFPVHAFYGSSETGGIAFDAEGGAAERGTVGLPIPGVHVDLDDDGRVRVAGPALGIRRLPAPDDDLADGVFRTGDLGRFEANGELRLLGRADVVINVRGKKVHPDEVERVLESLPGVAEAVVVGVPEPAGDSESVRAVVAGDAAVLSYESVVGWCRDHLAPHKVPRSVLLVPSIPRNERGKVDRDALRRWKA